jgi:penicillin-binding protein 2A
LRSKTPASSSGKSSVKAKKRGFSVGKSVVGLLILLLVVVILFTVGFFLLVQFTPFNQTKINDFNSPTVVYDGDNQKYLTLGGGSSSIPYSDIPVQLSDALVATEDHTFWTSPSSIDFRSILRAAFIDLWTGNATQGASTIQEQVAKMVYLTDNKTVTYKVKQVVLGVQLSRHYTKQEILDMYFNRVYLGSNATGVEQAAKLYFGIDLRKHPHLSWDQAALLAGLPQAPSAYDPLLHPHAALLRRNVVLQNLATYGYIPQSEALQLMKKPLGVSAHSMGENAFGAHPLFTNFLLDWATRHGISPAELMQGGLKVYTTVDPSVQSALHKVFFTSQYDSDWPGPTKGTVVEGGALFLDPKTGGILGAAGSRKQDYTKLGIDRVYSTSSPGSSIKPIMEYAPALQSGKWTYTSILDNTPHNFGGGYEPEGWDPTAPGKITLQYGLQWSQNVASVWLLQQLGIQNGVQFAESDGIPISPTAQHQLGIAIGGNLDVSPMIMAQAYEPFDDNGVQMQAHLINEIVNAKGQVIYRDPVAAKQIMTQKTARDMTRLMEDVVEFGTGQLARIDGWGVAGKTGTVQYSPGLVGNHPNWVRTGWFDAYTPTMVGSIYIGYDVTTPEHHMSWVTLDPSGNAAELWRDVVANAVANQTPEQFSVGPYPYANGLGSAAQVLTQPISNLQASWNMATHQVELNWKSKAAGTVDYQISREIVSLPAASPGGSSDGATGTAGAANGGSGSNTAGNGGSNQTTSSSAGATNGGTGNVTAGANASSGFQFIGKTSSTTFADPVTQPGATYTYEVQAVDTSSQLAVGQPLTVTITIPLSTLPNSGAGGTTGSGASGNPAGTTGGSSGTSAASGGSGNSAGTAPPGAANPTGGGQSSGSGNPAPPAGGPQNPPAGAPQSPSANP